MWYRKGPPLYFFLFFIYLFFNFTILYWFCHISTWIHHKYTRVPHPEPSSLLSPRTIPLGRHSAPAPSIKYHASNLVWRLISYMILYMFQYHSPKSSHPFPLPQSPKDCSTHQCLLCFVLPFFSQLFVRPPQTAIFFFAFLFLWDGLDYYLLYNVTNLHP